jgi:hypothetical protein
LHENYIVGLSPESFEQIKNFWQVSWLSRLLFHLLTRRLAGNGIAEQKLIPMRSGRDYSCGDSSGLDYSHRHSLLIS